MTLQHISAFCTFPKKAIAETTFTRIRSFFSGRSFTDRWYNNLHPSSLSLDLCVLSHQPRLSENGFELLHSGVFLFAGIIKKVPEGRLKDLVGDVNLVGTEVLAKTKYPQPALGDIKNALTEYIILPLGMFTFLLTSLNYHFIMKYLQLLHY